MPVWEGKSYKLDKSENFEDYMKALGVGLVQRKMGNSVSPTITLSKDGDEYTLLTSAPFTKSEIKFKDGVVFDEETFDGRKVKSTCTFENENKLIHKQEGEKSTTIIRDFGETEMVATMTIGEVKCVRVYKAI